MAEANGGRTHRRSLTATTAGFEDRESHRALCASAAIHSHLNREREMLQVYLESRQLATETVRVQRRMERSRMGRKFGAAEPAGCTASTCASPLRTVTKMLAATLAVRTIGAAVACEWSVTGDVHRWNA